MSNDVNFKRLDELEVIEEAGESTYAVVEENGVPKRIPGKKIGGGLPSGGAPYQQLVTDGEGVARWEDRTHYEAVETVNEPLNIQWDGSIDGLTTVGERFCKVSDLVLTEEQILSATVDFSYGESFSAPDAYMKISDNISGVTDGCLFVNADNVSVEGIVIPEAGIYFVLNDGVYVSKLTTTEPVEHEKTVVKTIAPRYLPEKKRYAIDIENTDDGNVWTCELDFATAYAMDSEDLRQSLAYSDIKTAPIHCEKWNTRTNGNHITIWFRFVMAASSGLAIEDIYLLWTANGITEITES